MGKLIGIGAGAVVEKDGASPKIGWFCAGYGRITKSNVRLKPMEKKFSQTAASKQKLKQERRWIRKEAKGSQCALKGGQSKAAVGIFYKIDGWTEKNS